MKQVIPTYSSSITRFANQAQSTLQNITLRLLFTIIFLSSMTAAQAQITGTWSQSGPGNEWQAQAGSVYVRVISTSNVSDISAQTMGCAGAYSIL